MARTALQVAVLSADINTIQFLLDEEPDYVLKNDVKILNQLFISMGYTSISSKEWIQTFELLLLNGADVKTITSYPLIPVSVFYHGSVAIMKLLVSKQFKLQETYKPWENHILHHAIQNPNFEVFQYLVEDCGLYIDSRNYFKETALHVASKNLWYDTIKKLISMGASPNSRADKGSPLTTAIDNCSNPSDKSIKCLLRLSTRKTVLDALAHTITHGHAYYIKPIIEHIAGIYGLSLFDPALIHFTFNITALGSGYVSYFLQCEREVAELKFVEVMEGTSLHRLYVQLYEKNYSILSNAHIRSYLLSLEEHSAFPIYIPLLNKLLNKALKRIRRDTISVYAIARILQMNTPGLQHISKLVASFLHKVDAINLAKIPCPNEIAALISTSAW